MPRDPSTMPAADASMSRTLRPAAYLALLFVITVSLSSCRYFREITSLRKVEFGIEEISNTRLADIDVGTIESIQDLRADHLARIMAAFSEDELPLRFDLRLTAANPKENPVDARLVTMDWKLFLNDRETISGTFDDSTVIPPGENRQITVPVELDLLRFYRENARDLIDLAIAVSGRGDKSVTVTLQATPIIQTRIGDIRYSGPITIDRRSIGARSP